MDKTEVLMNLTLSMQMYSLSKVKKKKSIIDVSPKNIREHLGMWLKIRIEMSKALVKSK